MKTALFALIVSLFLLLGCTDSFTKQSSVANNENPGTYTYVGKGAASAAPSAKMMYAEAAGASSGERSLDAAIAPVAASADQQYVTKEGSLTIGVKKGELESKLSEAKSILARQGATIESVYFGEYYSDRSYSITFKIAPEKFDSVTESLKSLGDIKNANMNIEDVTKQYTDLDMRIGNKEIELARLQALYNKSDKVEDIISVESELSRVEGELELLKGEKKDLEGRIDKSTITLVLSEPVSADEAREGEITVELKEKGLENGLSQLRSMASGSTIVSSSFAETSQFSRYYIVIRTTPGSLDSLMEKVKSLGTVTAVDKNIDEENRPKKSLLYVTLQENKPAVETDFLGNLKDIGSVFFGALTAGIFIFVGVLGLAIPILILVFIAYKLYKKFRGNAPAAPKKK